MYNFLLEREIVNQSPLFKQRGLLPAMSLDGFAGCAHDPAAGEPEVPVPLQEEVHHRQE